MQLLKIGFIFLAMLLWACVLCSWFTLGFRPHSYSSLRELSSLTTTNQYSSLSQVRSGVCVPSVAIRI
eukprot:m.304157 g.304157  ORF g.304157 m.304157 type:complete len:68 (-) comp15895_c1_seq1:2327-2530(-)